MEKHYSIMEAVEAQRNYCKKHDVLNFAPALDGKCYRCSRSIYRPVAHPDGHITGITVEEAGSGLITGCPHCHYSFID